MNAKISAMLDLGSGAECRPYALIPETVLPSLTKRFGAVDVVIVPGVTKVLDLGPATTTAIVAIIFDDTFELTAAVASGCPKIKHCKIAGLDKAFYIGTIYGNCVTITNPGLANITGTYVVGGFSVM